MAMSQKGWDASHSSDMTKMALCTRSVVANVTTQLTIMQGSGDRAEDRYKFVPASLTRRT